jgi:hypothetical protein
VDERACQFELLKFLKAEGLKVRMQYESLYGEPHEAISESWIDNDTILDIALTTMQQIAPKIVEQVQSMLPQFQSMLPKFQQLVARLQQMQVDAIKHMPDLAGLMLLQELYEDPPGAPRGWWLKQRGSPVKPKDRGSP